MISVDCEGCGREIHSRSKIVKGDAVQYNYECECGQIYFITILEGTKAYPAECDCCDGSCKESICPVCTERHEGLCLECKKNADDIDEPVPREDAIVSINDETSPREDVIASLQEKTCAAPEPTSIGVIIHTLELRKKRLDLEKEILDLDEYLYHARERERLR